LDEVVITIAGKKHWLWRAVDQECDGPGCLDRFREK
jgi:transposase-like protein